MERAKTAGILRLVAGIIICLGLVFTNFAQGYPETTLLCLINAGGSDGITSDGSVSSA